MESNLNRGDCCENITNKSRGPINELKYEMSKCQVALLDNKEHNFNSTLGDELSIGGLLTRDAEIIDESRLAVTMRFEIKYFSGFRYTFNKTHFVNQWFLVNNIPWSIGVEMIETDNDIYLEILYKPLGLSKQFLESNPINTIISLKMIKTNGQSYGQRIYNKKIDDNVLFRPAKLIALKDIMNPSNSLYNKKTDSVTLEVQIKIIQ